MSAPLVQRRARLVKTLELMKRQAETTVAEIRQERRVLEAEEVAIAKSFADDPARALLFAKEIRTSLAHIMEKLTHLVALEAQALEALTQSSVRQSHGARLLEEARLAASREAEARGLAQALEAPLAKAIENQKFAGTSPPQAP